MGIKRSRENMGWRYRKAHQECEVCGARADGRALDIHHVIPTGACGSNGESNLITLCKTHHKVAHVVGVFRSKVYFGPRDRVSLIKAICEYPEHAIPREILARDFESARLLLPVKRYQMPAGFGLDAAHRNLLKSSFDWVR